MVIEVTATHLWSSSTAYALRMPPCSPTSSVIGTPTRVDTGQKPGALLVPKQSTPRIRFVGVHVNEHHLHTAVRKRWATSSFQWWRSVTFHAGVGVHGYAALRRSANATTATEAVFLNTALWPFGHFIAGD